MLFVCEFMKVQVNSFNSLTQYVAFGLSKTSKDVENNEDLNKPKII